MVVAGDVLRASLVLEEGGRAPHIIGVGVTLKQHQVVQLPLSVALTAPPPRVFDKALNLIPRLPILDQRGRGGRDRQAKLRWPWAKRAKLIKMECGGQQAPVLRQV